MSFCIRKLWQYLSEFGRKKWAYGIYLICLHFSHKCSASASHAVSHKGLESIGKEHLNYGRQVKLKVHLLLHGVGNKFLRKKICEVFVASEVIGGNETLRIKSKHIWSTNLQQRDQE